MATTTATMNTVNSPFTKKLMIESQSTNGRCYVRLLSLLPNFKKSGVKELEHAIVYMTQTLGIKPEGSKVLPELFITNEMLGGDVEFANKANFESLNAINSTKFMEDVFDSTMRYSWEEIDGVHHIGGYIDSGKNEEEVYTDMGYSARFVLCIIINPGVRVGSEMTFHNLFDEIEDYNGDFKDRETEEEEFEKFMEGYSKTTAQNAESGFNISGSFNDSGIATENEGLKSNINDRLKEIEKLNQQVKTLRKRISETAGHRRSAEVDDQTIRRFADLFNKQTEIREKSPKMDVFPDDSSSNISRYRNKYLDDGTILDDTVSNMSRIRNRFLEDGTIFDVRGNGKTILQTNRTIDDLRPEKQIVVGFKKTDEMIVRENKIYKKITAINGLANPFHSHRLNFLCHFETAIKSIQIRKEDYTHFDIIIWISKHKSMSPSQELLFQVVTNTFDLEEQRVIANPYKLPFLEVGMLMSDDCLAKCFNLMRLEFKTLWFDKMKGLIVPDFHDEFSKHKEHKLTSNSNKDKITEIKEVRFNGQARSRRDGTKKKTGGSSLGMISEWGL